MNGDGIFAVPPEAHNLDLQPPMDEASLNAFGEQATDAARLLKLLGNESRLMIACLLITRGEMGVGELVRELRLSQSALSQHLARMRKDGVVKFRRSSQNLYYSIGERNAVELIALLKKLYCQNLR